MKQKKDFHALLVTDMLNQSYFHHLLLVMGAVYVHEERKVFLSWSGPAKLPDGVELRQIAKADLGKEVQKLLKEDGETDLTVENDIPLDQYLNLSNILGADHLIQKSGIVEKMRDTKNEWEIEQLRCACKITDAAFSQVLGMIKPGMTELEIAAELDKQMRLRGAEMTLQTMVLAGTNSAFPHHKPGNYAIQTGNFVMMDFGCTYHGYFSDMTRTVIVGKAALKQKEIYQTVLEAQLAGLEALEAGKTGGEVDGAARTIIDKAGYGEAFVHNLGHGIGRYIHEGTGLARGSDKILKPGMVVSVEPGIYIHGYGGVRIEDIAVVKEGGCEVLAHSEKQLIEL